MARGWNAIGIDIVDLGYPGLFIRQTLPHPLLFQFPYRPTLVVASPPCEAYARHHLPWIKDPTPPDEQLLRWSISLIGSFPTVLVECSRFAMMHVPGATWCRPYALWGDVPPLLPPSLPTKAGRRRPFARQDADRAADAAEVPEYLAITVLEYALARARRTADAR